MLDSFRAMREAHSLLYVAVMHAARPQLAPPPIPMSVRKPGPTTDVQKTPVRPMITVWIGNTSYQAVLV